VHALALAELESAYDVFQDLVEGVSDVQTAIGIGRPIVQNKCVSGWASAGLPSIKIVGAALEVGRWNGRACGEGGLGEVEG